MREGLWIMVEVEGHRRLFDEMTFELKHKDDMRQLVKTLRQIFPARGLRMS